MIMQSNLSSVSLRESKNDHKEHWSEDPWLRVRPRLEDSLLVSSGLCAVPPAVRPSYHPYDSQPVTPRDVQWNPFPCVTITQCQATDGSTRTRRWSQSGQGVSKKSPLCQPTFELPGTSRKPSGRVVSPPKDIHISWMGQGKDRRDPRCCITAE
ncbi:hypothetical protein NEOLEDRAFT_859659 [Neolentinus lepideus HHB14362 ss-1]|uniref:Uncharacterized protein n=1 Tax=Neolentinus lepideus HHB14362 ss-1 TaxID=1314782 RepID=A0A165URK6_9AGAM|nr:hypothetical protein NEOLEDRAFT_859659 [Neolentinus lepideus HHB14362 ss-1]